MPNITENDMKWIKTLADGPNRIPIKPFSSLRDKGLCRKLDQTAGQRGYVMAELTEAGRSQL